MSKQTKSGPRFIWESEEVPAGEDLANLRRGIGKEPGTVPAMWPYYRTLTGRGRLTDRLRAEHLALTLYGVHQQSKPTRVHTPDITLGDAIRNLKRTEKFSPDAVDRRFGAMATASSFGELGVHLRGLITQLRTLDHSGLDYTRLYSDLVAWQRPERASDVRRRWGLRYFAPDTTRSTAENPSA